MKKILIALIAALFCISCNTNDSSVTGCGYDENQFEVVSVEKPDNKDIRRIYILVHKETGVMYMYILSDAGYVDTTLSVMLNPDGTPCVYKKK